MTNYTHYSLFDADATVADFAKLPSGGLRELLADLHAKAAPQPHFCVAVGNDHNGHNMSLHPGAAQVSFAIANRFTLILYSREGLEGQAAELYHEGNASAEAAIAALKS